MVEKKTRAISHSFRINEQWLNALDEEADREGISSNALVNKILKQYCEYDRFAKRYGVVTLSQKALSRIVGACPKEALKDFGQKTGSVTAIDVFRTIGLNYTYQDVAMFIGLLGEYEGWYKVDRYKMKDKEFFHLRHNLGENWSIYVAEVLSTLIERCCHKKVKTEFLDGALTIELPLS